MTPATHSKRAKGPAGVFGDSMTTHAVIQVLSVKTACAVRVPQQQRAIWLVGAIHTQPLAMMQTLPAAMAPHRVHHAITPHATDAPMPAFGMMPTVSAMKKSACGRSAVPA